MQNKLSYTSVEKYMQCPRAWYLYYLRNMREKTVGSALPFGTAVDSAINELLIAIQAGNAFFIPDIHTKFEEQWKTQKINGISTDLSKTSLIKFTNTDFDVEILNKEDLKFLKDMVHQKDLETYHEDLIQLKREKRLTGESLKHFNLMSYTSLKQKGHMFINAYIDQVLPNIEEVLDVQKFFSLKNEEGDEFLGFIDYICRWKGIPGIMIKDNKTSSSVYKINQANESKQLQSYAGALIETNYTNEPLSIGFDVMNKVIRKRKEPKVNIQFIKGEINTKLIDQVFSDYDLVNSAIHAGKFESNHPSCSRDNFGSPCLCQIAKENLIYVPRSEKK